MMPRIGMYYDDVARRVKRIQKNPGHPEAKRNIIASLKNQCRLAEGEAAQTELERECALTQASFLTGGGNKQCGWGKGKKLGDGKWIWSKGTWKHTTES
jgi:hypothetical protein